MASSAELAVAKASLSATLFRADPTSCSRDDIDHFFALLNAAVAQCSPANVQKCKQWALRNLVPSSSRAAPLGKYLCALANSFAPKDRRPPKTSTEGGAVPREPSARRKRLHILYILNDIFYHVKFRDGGSDDFAHKLAAFLPALVRSVAAFPNCPKHAAKIQDLISLWEEKGYFSPEVVAELRTAAEQALVDPEQSSGAGANGATAVTAAALKTSRDEPFVMPAMHGDPTMPWYDLPAGNWLPVLEPNSTRPMKPSMIKPLQLAPGPADKALVEAVNKLLVDVDRLYSTARAPDSNASYDVDQMGEMVETDGVKSETYYGWSRAFCEKMKARRRKGKVGAGETDDRDRLSSGSPRSPDGRRSRSLEPRFGARDSSSRSRSPSSRAGFKRRRLPPSDSRNPPPRRMRSNHRSRSRSRSRDYRRGNSRSRSRSRSRRRSPSLSPDYSPPPPTKQTSTANASMQPVGYNSSGQFFNHQPPPFPGQQGQPQQPPQPPGGIPPFPNFSGGYQQQQPPFPVPPPPPQNYGGQWPPPPPPPPPPPAHQQQQQQQGFFQPGAVPPPPLWGGGWPPAPPPPGMGMPQQQYPPPLAQNQQQQQQQQQQQYQQYQQGQQQYPQHGQQQGYGRGFQGGQWRGGWS